LKFFKGVNLKELINDENDPAGGDDPRLMLFIIRTSNSIFRIVVDYRDKFNIFDQAYNWCDKYAKVNLDKDIYEKYNKKVFSIPPNFAISADNIFRTVFTAIHNTWLCYVPNRKLMQSFVNYFIENISNYFKRADIFKENKRAANSNYVFFISSLWQYRNSKEYDKYIMTVNDNRINYIELLKRNKNIKFEGGLYVYDNTPYNTNIDRNLLFNKRISHKQYIKKTMRSLFVFNTPSVWGCHGWKLGEFLAMGKAIISTKLYRDLPEPLIHGENIHYVNNEQELYEAIEKIRTNNEYRHHLERGAKQYYEKYCSPKSVISYIINRDIIN
jgi:glycosyltransferase involved in cell wall biosynthesis